MLVNNHNLNSFSSLKTVSQHYRYLKLCTWGRGQPPNSYSYYDSSTSGENQADLVKPVALHPALDPVNILLKLFLYDIQ